MRGLALACCRYGVPVPRDNTNLLFLGKFKYKITSLQPFLFCFSLNLYCLSTLPYQASHVNPPTLRGFLPSGEKASNVAYIVQFNEPLNIDVSLAFKRRVVLPMWILLDPLITEMAQRERCGAAMVQLRVRMSICLQPWHTTSCM